MSQVGPPRKKAKGMPKAPPQRNNKWITEMDYYMKAKQKINAKSGCIEQEELDFLKRQLMLRTTASLVVRYNTLAQIPRRMKTDKAEFVLIRNILNDRDRKYIS